MSLLSPLNLLLLLLLLLGLHQPAFARSHALSDIDHYCTLVQTEMSATTPFIFSGPDPWIELDEPPAEMPDEALAYIYTHGPSVRWVFLRLIDEEAGWQEDVHYYFREDGTIAKRIRQVQSAAANVELDVTTYYQSDHVLKEVTRHHTLFKGKHDNSDFSDPDAPIYLTVDDLPFSEITDLWRRLS